ncbi:putative lipoprotein [Agrobacterium vitis]|nr:putative lipoprotein [Agrobacterium vitis]MBE1437288.1 putative lipoprotein [Agrobacterium vitis]
MRIALTLAAFAGLALPLQAADPAQHAGQLQTAAVPAVMEKVVDGFIRPGYRQFNDKAGQLHRDVAALCAAPSETHFIAAKSAFTEAVKAWGRIEIVRVGPVIEDNRFEHVLFYPDRKGLALKQIQGAIASNDDSFAHADSLRQKSVAMQGLGALEYVLYGTGADSLAKDSNSFRCRYGAAIAGNVENLAAELSRLWEQPGGIQDAWKKPGPDNEVFRDGPEAVTGLLGILVHGTETVRDERIETFFRPSSNKTAPKQAIFWRSGLTFTSISANVGGVRDLLTEANVASLLPADKRGIVDKITTLANQLITTASTITPDMELAVSRDEDKAKLQSLLADSRTMITDLSDGVGRSVGLTAGFSFADGD